MRRIYAVFALAVPLLATACARPLQATYSGQNQTVPVNASLPDDPAVVARIAPYKRQLDAQMNRVIGQAPATLSNDGIRDRLESTLGNFVADLTRVQGEKYAGRPVDLGLTASGGLRASIAQGEITVGDVFELMPFENQLWVLTLRGETIEKLFQYFAKVRNLSIANARATLANGQMTDIRIGGKPLDPQATYTLATTDYLANGGDGLSLFKEASEVDKLPVLYRDAMLDYIETLTKYGKPVSAQLEGRIRVQ